MKIQKNKLIVMLTLAVILVSAFAMPVKAEGDEKIILKKANDNFLIYYKDMCNEEFEFAFSADKNDTPKDTLYKKSAKDQTEDGALNVAYVDSDSYNTYFKANDNKAYIWIKNEKDETKVSGDEINLSDALDDDMINVVNTTTIADAATDRIEVDTKQVYITNPVVEGVTTTVTRGKVIVKEKENTKYYYNLIAVSDDNADAKEMYDLAKTISASDSADTYTRLSQTKRFYELYAKLTPKDSDWKEVENSEILQPETARTGDRFIVYIKAENADGSVIDAKLLVSTYDYEEKRESTPEQKISKTVSLPVTFDRGTTLFIILGVLVVLLVIVMLARKKAGTKKNKNE